MKKLMFQLVRQLDKFGNGRMVFLMVLPKSNLKRVTAVLHLKKNAKIGDFQNKVKLIRKSMDGNTFFPTPPVTVAVNGVLDTDIKALDATQTVVLTRAKGTAAARDVSKQTVLNEIHNLQGYVQSIADTTPAKAIQIVQSSGFDVKMVTPHSKSDFSAKNTKVKGEVKLMVNVKKVTGGKKGFFKWQISTDNINWKELPSTTKGNTPVPALTHAVTYYFRFLVVLQTGESGWSAAIDLLVN